MIRLSQLKLNYSHTEQELLAAAAQKLKTAVKDIEQYKIIKKSIDARDKANILFIYTLDLKIRSEQNILKRNRNKNITISHDVKYHFNISGTTSLKQRPVIAGSGPAGLFCGLLLAQGGYRPIIVERGEDVDSRLQTVSKFWTEQVLNPESNVQFGEGGAGTFSDGKLNTLVKDTLGRNREVLETFVSAGAPEDILYINKPHIGTDILTGVVKNIRKTIIDLGGEILFNSKVTDIIIEDRHCRGIMVNDNILMETDILILAIGHSARDTFEKLYQKNLLMRQKSFAMGLRIEHPQTEIDLARYGQSGNEALPASDYKLTYKSSSGRGVYSFCMCPGGYVVNASSETGRITVNGMSNRNRDSKNANSAIIATVTPQDFNDEHPLAGMYFQRRYEQCCFAEAGGRYLIPAQLFGDFRAGVISSGFGTYTPEYKGSYTFGNLKNCLPDYLCDSIIEGIEHFGRQIKGFDREDAILSGIEARTSSPVRIERNEAFESNIGGVFPCGEGAGYAGGIMSAAMDGMKIAEEIARRYLPMEEHT